MAITRTMTTDKGVTDICPCDYRVHPRVESFSLVTRNNEQNSRTAPTYTARSRSTPESQTARNRRVHHTITALRLETGKKKKKR